jgi:hypothetical protein
VCESKETTRKDQSSILQLFNMPYIYTSSPLANKTLQSPDYQRRSITGQTTGNLDTLALIGFPSTRQPAYTEYLGNLSAFLHATAINAKVSCSAQYFKTPLAPSNLLPFKLPPLCISSSSALKTEDDKTAFLAKIPLVTREYKFGQRVVFNVDHISAMDLVAIPQKGIDPNTPSPPNSTNLFGLREFLRTAKILTLFLATHSYPAFSSPDQQVDRTSIDSQMRITAGAYAPVSHGYRGYFLEEAYRQRGLDQPIRDVVVPEAVIKDEDSSKAYDASFRSIVVVAKPAPFFPKINYGLPSDLPALPGYVLPYFPGVIHPSTNVFFNVFRRFFFNSFGSTQEEVVAGWQSWCRGVRNWHKSDEGMILAHITFCLQTALEAQARLFVIVSGGQYLGCAILGYHFVVIKDGVSLVADTPSEVRKLALGLDAHSTALTKICDMLSEVALDDDDEETELLQVHEIRNARYLHREINRRKRMEDAEESTLKDEIRKVAFDEKFWPIALDKVVLAIETMTLDDKEVNPDWPMHLDSSLLYDSTKPALVLSAFGPMAPSFLDSNGKDYAIPKGTAAEDPLSTLVPATGAIAMESILVSGKALKVAVQDWTNVVKNRRIRSNPTERAAGFRTIRFKNEGRNEIWRALKGIPFVETKAGEKRKRDRDGEDGTDRANKKRAADGDEVSIDLLDF